MCGAEGTNFADGTGGLATQGADGSGATGSIHSSSSKGYGPTTDATVTATDGATICFSVTAGDSLTVSRVRISTRSAGFPSYASTTLTAVTSATVTAPCSIGTHTHREESSGVETESRGIGGQVAVKTTMGSRTTTVTTGGTVTVAMATRTASTTFSQALCRAGGSTTPTTVATNSTTAVCCRYQDRATRWFAACLGMSIISI